MHVSGVKFDLCHPYIHCELYRTDVISEISQRHGKCSDSRNLSWKATELLTLGAHAPEGYSSCLVCCVCLSVGLLPL